MRIGEYEMGDDQLLSTYQVFIDSSAFDAIVRIPLLEVVRVADVRQNRMRLGNAQLAVLHCRNGPYLNVN